MWPPWSRLHCILLISVATGLIVYVHLNYNLNSMWTQIKEQLKHGQSEYLIREMQRQNELSTPTLPPDFITFEREKLAQQIQDLVTGEMEVAERENYTQVKRFKLDRGAEPVRVLLVAHMRSGSSFVADVLASHPGANYIFEPLMHLMGNETEPMHSKGGSRGTREDYLLSNLFRCQFTSLDKDYVDRLTSTYWFFAYNKRLIECNHHKPLCSDAHFLSQSCRAFPVQVVKVVRYRLDYRMALLEDETLKNLRVVYMVRDPRAIMNSRSKLAWCLGDAVCRDPMILCDHLAKEYHLSTILREKYPGRFTILRYETMAEKPFDTARDMFKFLHLMYTSKTDRFVQVHTSVEEKENPLSTYRRPNATLQGWMNEMNVTMLKYTEDVCVEAMKLWGYRRLT